MRLGTSRAMKAGRFRGNSIAPDVPSSYIGGNPSVDRPPARGKEQEGVLDEDLSEPPDYQRLGVSKEIFQIASKGAFGAAVIAGMPLRQQQNDHGHTGDGSTPQQAGGERRGSVGFGRTTPHLSESWDAHPSLGETRAVAVQTDLERVCGGGITAPTAISGKGHQSAGCQTLGVFSPVPLVDTTDDARPQRLSTTPEDNLIHSCGARQSTSSSTGPGGFDGGNTADTRQHICNTAPELSTPFQRDGMELRRPVSETADASAELHSKDPEKPSTAATDKRELLPYDMGGETENPVAPQKEHLALRPQKTLDSRGGASTDGGDGGSLPGALDPALEKRRAVDEVTQQLQEILREDALQDDGGCNTCV